MPRRWSRQGVANAWQADCLSPGIEAMQCPRHAKTKGCQGLTQGMPKEGVAKAWQADCVSPGKAMHCSLHAKTKGGQGMIGTASRMLVTRQGNALLTACQKKGWPRHGKPITCHRARQCIAHSRPRPRVAKARLTACQKKGWPRHGKPIACHRARQCLLTACQDQGWPRHDRHGKSIDCHRARQCIAQGMPRLTACQNNGWPRHAKPIACHRARQCIAHSRPRPMPKEGVAKAWQAYCISPGKAMHCSRHAKTKGGQGMTGMESRLLVIGQVNALRMSCQKKGWPRHGKLMACHRARQCIAHGMPRPRLAKTWQASCWGKHQNDLGKTLQKLLFSHHLVGFLQC
ncbi:hypothetical protein RHGRI_011033 [Rhododendron griersonianum]|uniref:Uncharacterized protein n=1 Tax=Rhododendron griersonianum TaxID=479676 RepID=A0AAV6KKK5_9ERIC|nr:hypothetical protein RHGRI_011033 [Rhododendron griersonianum]